jgi:phosphoglycerol transferase MdoB-like AlkP superfamily enzyme
MDNKKTTAALYAIYFLIVVNMYLGTKLYSISWAAAGFGIAAVLFCILKIGSRYLTLPAILLLASCPILLILKKETLAETAAIYVFYFMVSGVLVLFAENILKNKKLPEFG